MGGAVLADALPHAALPEGPPQLQLGRHAGLSRLAFCGHEPARWQAREGRDGARSGNAIPDNARIQTVLCEKYQLR